MKDLLFLSLLLGQSTYLRGTVIDNIFTRRYMPPIKKEEANYRKITNQILDSIMGKGIYDSRIRPSGLNGTDSASQVLVNIFVRSFSKIDDVKMEYSFQITLRQQWNDKRLDYTAKLTSKALKDNIPYLTIIDTSKVWMPDSFFRNEKTGQLHNMLTPNLYIRIFPNGDVLYSIRVSLVCSCDMHLALFPMDEQTCFIFVASYGWTKKDLIYVWKDGGALQFAKNLSLPGGFVLSNYSNEYCDVETATGAYSCLKVSLTFARELSYFLVTIYVPCFMIVVVSWFSFWLDHKAVPGRVTLGVTTLLAISNTKASIQRSLPPVAYTKAIDVWTGCCVFFVFSALLEYALVNYASRSDAQRAAKLKEKKERDRELYSFNSEHVENSTPNLSMDPLLRRLDGSQMIPPGGILPLPSVRPSSKLSLWVKKFKFEAKKIDVMSRVVFPVCFALFTFWYWTHYLSIPKRPEPKAK